MSYFWDGFEKRAASIIGRLPNVASGLRRFEQGSMIKPPKGPTAGVSIAPRSTAVPLPTPTPAAGATKAMTPVAGVAQPKIPKPSRQTGRGVSSMSI